MSDPVKELKEQIPESLEKWQCLACHSTLGYVENKKIIRIKRKDLYIRVNGGDVEVICYKCGKSNELRDDKTIPGVVDIRD